MSGYNNQATSFIGCVKKKVTKIISKLCETKEGFPLVSEQNRDFGVIGMWLAKGHSININ